MREINYELLDAIKWARNTYETAVRLGEVDNSSVRSIDAHFTRRASLQLRRLVESKDEKTRNDAFTVMRAYSLVEEELLS